ncbi:MAG: tyrosine-type recombinase/integrase, partial [Akkermansia sp.]
AIKVFVVQNPRKALSNACIRLGIAHVRVHDLRHFFATSCIESGIDIPTVSRCSSHIGMDEKRRIAGSYLRAT